MPAPAAGQWLSLRPIVAASVLAFGSSVFSVGAIAQTTPPGNAGQAGQAGAQNDVALPAVTVQGAREASPNDTPPAYVGGQIARGMSFGVLGNQSTLDVPFSMSAYTSKMIEDQQARTLADVLDNDPSVRMSRGFGNFAQTFVIRGFTLAGDDISLNGLYGITPRQLVSTEALERVELFKGANAFLNGASPGGSAIGGGVNLQLKRADDTPLNRVTLEGSGSGEFGAHVDVGRRFGSEGQFGIRVNQAVRDGETSVDREHQNSKTTAVALDWRGDKLRLSADFLYQKQHIGSGRALYNFSGTVLPQPPAATSNYAQSWSYTTLEDNVGILRAEYDFLPHWTAYVTGGIRHTNENGEYSNPTWKGSPSTITATRLNAPHQEDALSGEVGVRGRFTTGPVTHFVTAGASGTRLDSQSAFTFAPAFSTSFVNPPQVPYPAATSQGGNLNDPQTTALTLLRSVSASDTLGFFNDRVLATVGVRHQSIGVNNYGYTGAQTLAYNDAITTPLFGLVFKPWQNVSLFANRSEGLAAGTTAPQGTLNYGQSLPPFRSKQIEFGAKYDTARFGASIAFYQIEKPSAYTNASNVYVADGLERHRGVEASVYGSPVKDVRVIAGVSYINGTLLNQSSAATNGNRPVGVPTFSYNLGAEYDIPWVPGLTLNARWIHTGREYANIANTASIPAWDRFDLGARYATQIYGKPTTFRVSVLNVTNKAYWSSVSSSNYLTLGAPRTFLLSMTTDF
ncbi:TonB-dependent receptor [Pandoraea capi]|uniref:TonB-dependent receptor n=1 Tax=Pandoraea capi TaxID=2508286 RepID=A0ABY6VX90_9BURK|nr:TonB-dependent siderophore receptor [Pandoraea capi]VVD99910.1 TonB-dependent receptor [Pandoraea capi]